MPVTARAMSLPASRRAPLAMAFATSALTAPLSARSSPGTSRSLSFAPLA
jgi:hypothetical protein